MEEAFRDVNQMEWRMNIVHCGSFDRITASRMTSTNENKVYYSSGVNDGVAIWNVHVWKAKDRRSPLQAHGCHCNVVKN
jgi:hypothetical protein